MSVNTTTATSISLCWTSPDSLIDNYTYEVMWNRDTSGECPDEDEGTTTITDGSTSYDIMGLEEDSSYSITVIAHNASSTTLVNDTVTAETKETGK